MATSNDYISKAQFIGLTDQDEKLRLVLKTAALFIHAEALIFPANEYFDPAELKLQPKKLEARITGERQFWLPMWSNASTIQVWMS
ncbi:hypothetical protein ACI2KR_29895 [Pseudomonas luteola]